MAKRQLILNGYRTAEDGLWTLSYLKVQKATPVENFIDVPGRFAPLDASAILTDGEPYYGSAYLEAVLESSEGNRTERQERISSMVNELDGYSVTIIHPDHPGQYMVGRVQVAPEYNDLAHCAVRVTATCEAWFYNEDETEATFTATTAPMMSPLTNSGRLAVVPTIVVTGEVTLLYGAYTWTLSAGTYQLPELYLTPGEHWVDCSGSGTITFTYREAVLAE